MWLIILFMFVGALLIILGFRLFMAPPNLKWLRRHNPEKADQVAARLLNCEYGKEWRD
jgi:hypothetical protein